MKRIFLLIAVFLYCTVGTWLLAEEQPQTVQPYGIFYLHSGFNSNQISVGRYYKYVNLTGGKDYFLSAQASRFGLKVQGPGSDSINTKGLLEADFQAGDIANKSLLQMRHAYFEINFTECKSSILVGQSSDVISPLVAPVLDYPVLWWTGNIGFRHSQFRLTHELPISEQMGLKFIAALSENINSRKIPDPTDATGVKTLDLAEKSYFPTAQGDVQFYFKMDKQLYTMDISGHFKKEEYTKAVLNKKINSWSLNLSLSLPFTEWLKVETESWIGENLAQYNGGVDQGVSNNKSVKAYGGWGAVSMDFKPYTVALGGGLDNPKSNGVALDREYNMTSFINTQYSINPQTSVGIELAEHRTKLFDKTNANYKNRTAYRVGTRLMYKF